MAIPDATNCALDRKRGFVNAIHCALAARILSALAVQPPGPAQDRSC